MKDEVNALKSRGVWRVVQIPGGGGVRLIKSKYVYRVKKDWTGKVVKRKSRLVVQGFSQREGIDYDETFAPVAKVTTFRLMLALSKVLNLQIHQLDVDSAFLYADLDEDVYVKPPPGMSIKWLLSEVSKEPVWTKAISAKLEQEHSGSHQVDGFHTVRVGQLPVRQDRGRRDLPYLTLCRRHSHCWIGSKQDRADQVRVYVAL